MPSFDRAAAAAQAAIFEVKENALIRQKFDSLLVPRATQVFAWGALSAEIGKLLAINSEPSVLYRGLFVQTISIFESYIKQVTYAVLEMRRAKADSYEKLPEGVRLANIFNTGTALRAVYDGPTIDHAAYMKAIGTCSSGETAYTLNAEGFVLDVGNCKMGSINKHFKKLGAKGDFSDAICSDAALQKWSGTTSVRKTSDLVEATLDEYVDRRNTIVHRVDASMTFVPQDIEDVTHFMSLLTEAIKRAARAC